ncbi:MAG: PspC domain-containing protein [Spirochaetales bacterium]|nr:PspC domain-containing protein [Spirochaetales bacterium]
MKLERTMDDRVLAGVCGGVARELGLEAKKVRWAFALLVLFAGLSLWVYFILWFVMPPDDGRSA